MPSDGASGDDPASGFTLLEVMVALAILSSTLVVLLRIVTNNVRATNHAKMTTAATFLARTKMVELEDNILYDGFIETNESRTAPSRRTAIRSFAGTPASSGSSCRPNLAQQTQDEARGRHRTRPRATRWR